MGRARVTLADVAAASGVSITTASLVLTGRARELRISTAAEQRVRSTAQELGYRRGTHLVRSRAGLSRTIGLVLGTAEASGPVGGIVRGAVEAACRRGFMLLVSESGGDPAVERALVEALRDRQADGIVLAPVRTRAVALPDGLRHGPAVLLNATNATFPSVVSDEVRGGRAAARLLVEAGHVRGVHLVGAGPEPCGVVAERLTGLRKAFAAAGVEVAGVRECPKWTAEQGYEATAALLRRQRPQALVCLDDRLAFGAYQALADAGLSVPGDVSVLGFGDHPVSSWMRPRLTTIAHPHHELGERAVEVLLDVVEGRDAGSPSVHRLPMPVRAGGSVAPACSR